MIQRVVEQAKKSASLSHVLVATDDERIFSHVKMFCEVVMTSPNHNTGTERCLEALEKSGITADAVINIQGDEPFIDPAQIDALAVLISKPEIEIATLAKKIDSHEMLFDPNKVKVVFGLDGRALYFSRQPIPFLKNVIEEDWHKRHAYFKHIGLYAYKTNVLKEICALPTASLEQSESLEQLRWLENGRTIHITETTIETPSVDTPEDLQRLLLSL